MPPEPPRNRLFDLNPIHRSHPLRMDRKRLRETQHQQGNLKTMKRFHRMLRCGPSKPAASYPPYGSIEGTIRHHVHGKPAGTQTERLQRKQPPHARNMAFKWNHGPSAYQNLPFYPVWRINIKGPQLNCAFAERRSMAACPR